MSSFQRHPNFQAEGRELVWWDFEHSFVVTFLVLLDDY